MSLVLDMQQELAQDSVWPIYLETEQDTVAVKLNLGDALLYPGSHFKHWREAYDQSVSVVMFHFVTHDYEGILG